MSERQCRRCGRGVDARRSRCAHCGLPTGGLIEAARLQTIARELVSIAPDAPWFLRALVGGNSSLPADREPRAGEQQQRERRRNEGQPGPTR